MLKDVCNTLQNFEFIRARDFEIMGGPADPLVSGVGTKRLGTEKVKFQICPKRSLKN